MCNNHPNFDNKENNDMREKRVRTIFVSLKLLAILFFLSGFILVAILALFNLSKRDELLIIGFFGLVNAGFLIARTRSLLLEVKSQHKKE